MDAIFQHFSIVLKFSEQINVEDTSIHFRGLRGGYKYFSIFFNFLHF